ncbi:MAG: ribonuclease H-like domain-containing protein [Dehalococcoidia bacterium]
MNEPRSLRERLRGLGALKQLEPSSVGAALAEPERSPYLPPEPPPEPGVEAYLPGFWQDTPDGRIFVVEQRFELDHLHGAIPLGRTLDVPGHVVARIGRDEKLRDIAADRLLYLDTETTGLSGGTGTYAFLVGIGHFIDGGFRLRQYFQTDFGQEPALLRALADYMVNFDAVVTFNGKSFDLPLLETRFTIGGLTPGKSGHANPRELPHLDLLHPARRIYRDRLASCRLGELEQHVLGLVRHEDVPGWEIPSLYFRYVRTGRFRAVIPVFEHNALDVLSLVTLTAHLCDLFGGDGARSAEDRFALGRACEADGLDQQAIANFRAALEIGLTQADQRGCEERLSLLCRRLGRWDEAVALWETVIGRANNRQLYAYVELAKYHEHVARDFARAAECTRDGLALLERHHLRYGAATAADRAALLARIERLERRLSPSAMKGRG